MGDLINRQDAIRWVKTECNPYGNPTLDFESGKKVIEHLEQMPSAQPERKKGEWIKKIYKKEDKECIGYTPYWYCSECGKRYEPAIANTIINYCYNCGADMRGENNDRE